MSLFFNISQFLPMMFGCWNCFVKVTFLNIVVESCRTMFIGSNFCGIAQNNKFRLKIWKMDTTLIVTNYIFELSQCRTLTCVRHLTGLQFEMSVLNFLFLRNNKSFGIAKA
jgi:hypothetical protein